MNDQKRNQLLEKKNQIMEKMPNAQIQEALGISRNSVSRLRRGLPVKVDFQKGFDFFTRIL